MEWKRSVSCRAKCSLVSVNSRWVITNEIRFSKCMCVFSPKMAILIKWWITQIKRNRFSIRSQQPTQTLVSIPHTHTHATRHSPLACILESILVISNNNRQPQNSEKGQRGTHAHTCSWRKTNYIGSTLSQTLIYPSYVLSLLFENAFYRKQIIEANGERKRERARVEKKTTNVRYSSVPFIHITE